jgi:two-component system NtrC family response regulator
MAEGKRVTATDLELADNTEIVLAATLKEAREQVERQLIKQALKRHSGRVSSAATDLGISRPTLYELMDKLGIGRGDASPPETSARAPKAATPEPQKG